jgi:hypothetical protein
VGGVSCKVCAWKEIQFNILTPCDLVHGEWMRILRFLLFMLVVLIGKMEDSNKEVRKSRAQSAGDTVEESYPPLKTMLLTQ